jgi:hypothetical protein
LEILGYKRKKKGNEKYCSLDCHHYFSTTSPFKLLGEVWLVVELGQQIKHGLNNPTPRLVP